MSPSGADCATLTREQSSLPPVINTCEEDRHQSSDNTPAKEPYQSYVYFLLAFHTN